MLPQLTHAQWDETANAFAEYVRQFRTLAERGVAPIRVLEEEATTTDVATCPVVVGVFGNDYHRLREAQREIDLVRDRLRKMNAVELGFGVSHDDGTWALLIGGEASSYVTMPGQTMQRELFKAALEDAVWSAWWQIQMEQNQLSSRQ